MDMLPLEYELADVSKLSKCFRVRHYSSHNVWFANAFPLDLLNDLVGF